MRLPTLHTMLKLNKFEQKQYKNEIAKANAAAKNAAKTSLPVKRFTKQVKEELPSEAPLNIKARAERLERVTRRVAFSIRAEKTLPPGFKHKEHVSPLLDLTKHSTYATTSQKAEAALYEYSKRHRCPHGLCWNKYDLKHQWVLPKCDHLFENPKYSELDDADINSTCLKCGSDLLLVERMCHHEGRHCPRCKINYYKHDDRWALVSCNCNMFEVLDEIRTDGNNPQLSIVAPTWKAFYDAQQSIVKTWLDKHLRWKFFHEQKQEERKESRRVTSERTFASFFKEEPRRVVPEGIGMSTITTASSTTWDFLIKLLDQFKNLGSIFKDFKTIEGVGRLIEVIGLIAGFLETTLTVIKDLPITETYLIASLIRKGSWFDYIVLFFHILHKYSLASKLDNIFSHSTLGELVSCEGVKNLFNYVKKLVGKFFPDDNVHEDSLSPLRAKYEAKAKILRMEQHNTVDNPQFDDLGFPKQQPAAPQQEGFVDVLSTFVSFLPSSHSMPLFKTISLFSKDILPIINVTKNVTQIAASIYQWLRKVLGFWTIKTSDWIMNEVTDQSSILNELVGLAAEFKGQSYLSDPNAAMTRAKLIELVAKAVQYLHDNGRYDPVGIRFISEIDRILASPISPSSRQHEPFCVRIYGHAGTGKSRNVPVLFGPIFGCKSKAEFDNLCFTRGSSQFWDGAAGRPIVFYDDFGQNISTEMDLLELIALVSASPFMPDFATLSGPASKGVSLDPKIVICCSNIHEDNSKNLLERQALSRRFHLIIQTTSLVEGGVTKTYFRCVGGSLVKEHLIPVSKTLDPQVMSDFIYQSYSAFLKSRKAGVTNNDTIMETMSETHPPLLWKKADITIETTNYPVTNLGKYAERPEIIQALLQASVNTVQTPNMPVRVVPNNRIQPLMNVHNPQLDARHARDSFLNFEQQQDALMSEDLSLKQEGFAWRTLYTISFHTADIVNVFAWSFLGATMMLQVRNWWDGYRINWRYSMKVTLSMLALSLAATVGMYYSYKALTAEDTPESSIRKPRNVVPVIQEGMSQAFLDDQQVIEKAACRIERVNPDGSIYYGVNGLFVGGLHLLTVEHIFVPTIGSDEWIPEGSKLNIITANGQTQQILFNSKRINKLYRMHGDSQVYVDACTYTLPADIFTSRRNIVKKFWEGDHLLSKTAAAMLDRVSSTTLVWKETVVNGQRASVYSQSCKTWRQVLAYGTHASQPGSCGAIAVKSDGTSNAPVLGIHVARDHIENRPMILLITRSMLERVVKEQLDPPKLENPKYFVKLEGLTEREEPFVQGNLFAFGRMKNPVHGSTKTQLTPSPLHDLVVKHTTEPSILSSYDARLPDEYQGEDFLLRCTEKLRTHVEISEFELSEASEELDEYYSNLPTTAPNILTLKQAVNGDQFINSLDLSTSPGFPGVTNNLRKTAYFKRPDSDLIPTTLFYQELYEDLKLISENQCPDWLAIGNLKDERRPIKKVRVTPKTRLFSVCSQNHNILQKLYYGPFMWKCMENMFEVAYSGGIDRLGASWHTLIERLLERSSVGFGGDYECYDGKFSHTLVKHGLRVMTGKQRLDLPFVLDRTYYLDEAALEWIDKINALKLTHKQVKAAVDYMILNPAVVIRALILILSGTVSSGYWITQLLDTVGNELMFLCGWNHLVPIHAHGYANFRALTRLYIMGDDNIIAVAREILPYFNGETYAQWLADRNMVYTSADKNGKAKRYQDIITISFLKNTTTTLKHMWAPLMEFEAAVEPINWIRRSKEHPDDLCEQNCSGVMRAVFFHGPDIFNGLRQRILHEKPGYKLPTYNTLRLQYLAYGYFPGFCPEKDFFESTDFPLLENVKFRRDVPEGCADRQRPTQPVREHEFFLDEEFPELVEDLDFEEYGDDFPEPTFQYNPTTNELEYNHDLDIPRRSPLQLLDDDEILYAEQQQIMQDLGDFFPNTRHEYGPAAIDLLVETLIIFRADTAQDNVYSFLLPDNQYLLSAMITRITGPNSRHWTIEFNMNRLSHSTTISMEDDVEFRFYDYYRTMIPEGIERFQCPKCEEYFLNVNRLADHLSSAHVDDETWKQQSDINNRIATAPVVQWRRWYTELNTALTKGDRSPFVRELREAGYKENDAYSTLNWLINQIKNKTFVDVPKGVACNPAWNISAIIKGGIDPEPDFKRQQDKPFDEDKMKIILDLLKSSTTSITINLPSTTTDPYLEFRDVQQEMDVNAGKAAVVPTATTVKPTQTTTKTKADIGDPTNEVAETVNSHGYIHADKLQDTVVTVQKGMGARATGRRAELSMNDVSWDLQKMLEKYSEFASVPWKITDDKNTKLQKFDVIADLVKTSFAGSPFGAFNNFRAASINVRVVLAASKFHQGRVVVGFIPKMLGKAVSHYALEQTVVGYSPIDAARLIELGAVIMDPAQGGTAYLNIPFVHPKGFLSLLQNDSLGQIYVIVLSQLNASTGASTEVRVKLSFSLDQPEFKIPRASPLTFQQYRMIEEQAERLNPVIMAPPLRRVHQEAGNLGAKKSMSAQKDIHEAFREAVPIAPVRALTADPTTVPHFGEHDDDLLNWGKRYRKIALYDETFTPPASKWIVVPLSAILSSFWFMSWFAAYRGRLRFKAFLHSGSDTNTTFSGTAWARFWWAPQEQVAKQQYALLRDDTPSTRTISGQCAEFETPFLNQSGIALNPIIYSQTSTNQNTDTFMSDYALYINIAATAQVATRCKLELYVSLADEFQPGVFISSPPLMVDTAQPGYFTYTAANDERKVIQEGLPELVADGLSEIAEKLIPENVVGTVLETLLDKPAVCDPPIWIVPKQAGFLNFSTQPEPMDKLQLHPASQQLVDPEHFGTPVSECKLKTWFNRKSLIGSFQWKTTTPAEELVLTLQTGPMFELPIDFGASNTQIASIMSAVSKNYTYWRGGITYIFDVVTSAFHEGRLDVTYHPNNDLVPADYNTRVSQYTVSVPIKNTENTFAITVPYLGETPWKRVWDGRPTESPNSSASPPSIANYSTGVIGVSVSAPLRVPDGVSPEVEVLVYVLPAEDFQLAEKTPHNGCVINRPYF